LAEHPGAIAAAAHLEAVKAAHEVAEREGTVPRLGLPPQQLDQPIEPCAPQPD
jgi:hypothetical protein